MAQQFDSAAIISNSDLPAVADTDDDETSDVDSAVGDMRPSTTETVASKWFEPIERHGRGYHSYADGKYFLPNDAAEQERLDLQNELWVLTLNGNLCLAPVHPVPKVLDIGTGTGIWAIEFGEKHPEASVTGIDLSPIQPSFVPPNVEFEVVDVEDKWLFSRTFNYIHGRMLFTCFENPEEVIKSAYKSLDPGGYLELQDMQLPFRSVDGTLDGTYIQRWVDYLIRGAGKLGKDWMCTEKYKKYMKNAGFVDITEKWFHWPINTWPETENERLKGLYCVANLQDGLEGFSMHVLTSCGWSEEEVQLLLVDVRKDLKNKAIHAYIPISVVYGRKLDKI